jgi:CPA1 family monovalent cation:H+ antiporter
MINVYSRDKIPLTWQHTAFWGGLHGTIPIALALGLSKALPSRDLIIAMTFGVVLFSLVIQALSFELLVPKFKLVSLSEKQKEYEEKLGKVIAIKAAREELQRMERTGEISHAVYDELRGRYEGLAKGLSNDIAALVKDHERIKEQEKFLANHRALLAQKSAIRDAVRRGIISGETAEKLTEEIDIKIDALYEK